MSIEKNKVAVMSAVTAALVALLVLGILYDGFKDTGGPVSDDPFRPNDPKALPTVEGGTREKLSAAVSPSEAKAASPSQVQKVGERSRMTYDIRGENGGFEPSTIMADEGDVIVINLAAVDGDYDIFFPDFGVYRGVKHGETGKLSFQAYPYGDYKFFCENNCIGRPSGRLIVNEVE